MFFLITLHVASALIFEVKAQDEKADAQIAIIGCYNQHVLAPAIPYIAEILQPDVTIRIEDNVYTATKDAP